MLGEPDVARRRRRRPSCSPMTIGRRRTPRDPAVLGQTLVVAGQPLTIVGVAPRGFVGTTPGERPDVFAPLTLDWFRGRLRTPLVRGPLLQLRLRVRALEARRLARAGASGARRDVPRDRQRRRSACWRLHALTADRHRGAIARRACRSCPAHAARAGRRRLARTPLACSSPRRRRSC